MVFISVLAKKLKDESFTTSIYSVLYVARCFVMKFVTLIIDTVNLLIFVATFTFSQW